ncbi:MAG: phasin family protein [Pseudomonadales bacterium]
MSKQQSTPTEMPLDKATPISTISKDLEQITDEQLEAKLDQIFHEEEQSPKIARLINGARNAVKTLWRANLGAAILLEKNSVTLFSHLVEEGAQFQNRAKDEVGKTMGAVKKSALGAKNKATGKIHNFEHKIDTGVNNTLHWIGVPSRNDFESLTGKVNELSESLTTLTQQLRQPLEQEQPEQQEH